MRAFYFVSVSVHVLAAMTWVGGMLLFVLALMPALRRQGDAARQTFLSTFTPRFRVVAWASLSTLVLTGVVNLSMRGVRFGDFLRAEWRATEFGQLIIAKLTLVLVAVVLSPLHERVVVRSRARWLGRLTLLIGLVIVVLAVLLVRRA